MTTSHNASLADRLTNLGTETAFAVSQAAAEWAAAGHRVYPFHLGDLDLATPANIVAAMNTAINAGHTGYCPAAGIPALREALADDLGRRRHMSFSPDQIVVQPGGKPVITKFLQTVMNPGDGVLFPSPGYPIYESQIDYLGGRALPYGYTFSPDGFRIDMDALRAAASTARVLIYNDLQNPLGCESSDSERAEIARLAVEHDLWVLSDEAYFEMRYSGSSTSIASLPDMADRTVILHTFSKKFAMTGWRLGCAVAPGPVAAQIAKLNTNDESCTTHFVQHAGIEALHDPSGADAILAELLRRRDAAANVLSAIDGVQLAVPEATFYLFPYVGEAMERTGHDDVGEFATAALHATGVSFCTRRHFGRPLPGEDDRFVRFAYSGLGVDAITEGLSALGDWIHSQ